LRETKKYLSTSNFAKIKTEGKNIATAFVSHSMNRSFFEEILSLPFRPGMHNIRPAEVFNLASEDKKICGVNTGINGM